MPETDRTASAGTARFHGRVLALAGLSFARRDGEIIRSVHEDNTMMRNYYEDDDRGDDRDRGEWHRAFGPRYDGADRGYSGSGREFTPMHPDWQREIASRGNRPTYSGGRGDGDDDDRRPYRSHEPRSGWSEERSPRYGSRYDDERRSWQPQSAYSDDDRRYAPPPWEWQREIPHRSDRASYDERRYDERRRYERDDERRSHRPYDLRGGWLGDERSSRYGSRHDDDERRMPYPRSARSDDERWYRSGGWSSSRYDDERGYGASRRGFAATDPERRRELSGRELEHGGRASYRD